MGGETDGKSGGILRPGIEPGSSACEALVLTDIRTKLCMKSQITEQISI